MIGGGSNRPVGLDIPAIDLHVQNLQSFVADSEGGYHCPADPQTAAWNRDGTRPAEPGLAQIIASAEGAFRRLHDVGPDDPIYVMLANGARVTFRKVDQGAAGPTGGSARLELTGCGAPEREHVYAALVG
jgi:hypothetical protein